MANSNLIDIIPNPQTRDVYVALIAWAELQADVKAWRMVELAKAARGRPSVFAARLRQLQRLGLYMPYGRRYGLVRPI